MYPSKSATQKVINVLRDTKFPEQFGIGDLISKGISKIDAKEALANLEDSGDVFKQQTLPFVLYTKLF